MLAAAGLGVGAWGVARLAKSGLVTTATPRSSTVFQAQEAAAPPPVYVVDSSLAAPVRRVDTAGAARSSTVVSPDGVPAPAAISHAPAGQLTDSTAGPATTGPTPLIAPDSAAVPSPAP